VNCTENKAGQFERSPYHRSIIGIWIPQNIEWGSNIMIDDDSMDIFRIASFYTLCFDSSGVFTLLASTQRQPRNYDDSIIFAGEPAVDVYSGKWELKDTSVINLTYKVKKSGIIPLDNAVKYEKLKFVLDSVPNFIFQGKTYNKTFKYDYLSLKEIEMFKKN
jgi:hypothetical protein